MFFLQEEKTTIFVLYTVNFWNISLIQVLDILSYWAVLAFYSYSEKKTKMVGFLCFFVFVLRVRTRRTDETCNAAYRRPRKNECPACRPRQTIASLCRQSKDDSRWWRHRFAGRSLWRQRRRWIHLRGRKSLRQSYRQRPCYRSEKNSYLYVYVYTTSVQKLNILDCPV